MWAGIYLRCLCCQGFSSTFLEAGGILQGHRSFSCAYMSSRLMQRKFSEPNTYIDGLPSRASQEELYDDVEMSELTAVVSPWTEAWAV